MQDDQADLGLEVASAVPDRVLHSDPHDFAGLYIRHRASFTLHARRYLKDARDADEVVQEAFLRLFLALPELETELQALAYCRRTITNLCIDRYRAQARRPHLVDLESISAEDLADEEQDDPVVRAEDAALVREALSMLSPLHRAALVKREIEEKTIPVIAGELDIPEESVKHVLFRARRALRRVLAGTSVAPDILAAAARRSGGGLAALAMLLAVGLGTGPDLRSIPVVGSDLPDLPGITQIAKDVIQALTGSASGGADDSGPVASGGDGGAPLIGAAASPSPTPSATASPSGSPSPAASPSATALTVADTATVTIGSPTAGPSRGATPQPSPSRPAPAVTEDPVRDSPPDVVPTAPAPTATPTPAPTAAPTTMPTPAPDPAGSPTPAPEPTVAGEPSPEASAESRGRGAGDPTPAADRVKPSPKRSFNPDDHPAYNGDEFVYGEPGAL